MGTRVWCRRGVVVGLLVIMLAACVFSGSALAADGATITVTDDGAQVSENETAASSGYSASSAGSATASTAGFQQEDSDDSFGGDPDVAVTTIPKGASFSTGEMMTIFVGAFDDGQPPTGVEDENLNVTVEAPNGSVETFSVTTDSEGAAQVQYDLTNRQEGTYQVTVDNGGASATIEPVVGPAINEAERDFEDIPVGEESDFDFLVRSGEFAVANEQVNITVEAPDGTIIDEYQTTTDSDGFVSVAVTPEQQGEYEVTAEVTSTGATAINFAEAREIVFRSSPFGLEGGLSGEVSSFGGYLLDGDGPVSNTEVIVEFRNESDVVVANETATSNSNGFLYVDYIPNGPDDLGVNVQTTDGNQVLESEFVQIEVPSDGGGSNPDSGVELSVEERDFEVVPGETATFDIEATDNGTPIANQEISIFTRLDFNGAPLATRTVTTDENGMAVVDIPTSNKMDGGEIDGEAVMEYNGTTYTDFVFTEVQQYRIDLETQFDAQVGEETTFIAEAENLSSGGGGENIPLQYNALTNGYDIDSYATGEIVTNATGTGADVVTPPRSLTPYNGYTVTTPYSVFSGYRVNVFQLPGSASVAGDTEVAPGEQLTVQFSTPDGTPASGLVFAEFDHENDSGAAGNDISTISTGTDGTLSVPDYAADGDFVDLTVWAADNSGDFYTGEVFLEVNASTEDPEDPLSVNLSAAPTTVEAGDNVTLDATASGSVNQYQWDVDGDGTTEQTTTSSTLTYQPTEPGSFTPTVTAVGADTATASTDVTVVDTTPPTAVLTAPSTATVGEQITLDAGNSSDNSYVANYTWTVSNETTTVRSETTTDSSITFTPTAAENYTASVTVTDSVGNANTTTVPIEVVVAANLETSVTTNATQRFGEPVTATISVTNTGSTPTSESFRVAYDARGTPYQNATQVTTAGNVTVAQSLAAGETVDKTVTLSTWVQENRITGDVRLDAVADPDGNVSEARLIDNDATARFAVTFADLTTTVSEPTVATAATNATVRTYVRNNGTATGSATDVTVTLTDSDGTTVQSETVAIGEVSPDGRARTTIAPALAPGEYTVTATVADATFPEGNTSSATFTVDEYNLTAGTTNTPAELEVGQNSTVAFTFQANDDAPVDATLALNNSGLRFQDGQADTVTVTPEPNQPTTATFDVQANETLGAPTGLDFTVSDEGGLDSTTATAAINVTQVTETVTDSAAVTHEDSDQTTNLTVYNDGVSESQTLTVSVQAGGSGRTLQGLAYLVNYPYGCVEQTTSAFLGALETDQYYRDRPESNISDPRQDVINGSIDQGVGRLNQNGRRGQQPDGSWNMWGQEGAPGDTFYSVYALYGTSEVASDPIYGPQTSDELDQVDFDQAVVWLNDEDQNADGSFSAYAYIDDAEAMTGFTMLAVNTTAQTDRVSSATQANITELQAEGVEYLLSEQEASGAWNNGDARSTALAMRGLQAALDNGAATEADASAADIQAAIDASQQWLIDNQNSDGSWEPYHDSSFYNEAGDRSVTTAYAVLALNETGVAAENATITAGTNYLIDVYEADGSWGYPRATAISIEALDELTDAAESGTMTITFAGAGGQVTETVTVNADNPEETITLSESQLATLRGDGEGTTTVDVTVTDDGASGTIIVGLETTQEIIVGGESQ